MRSVKRWLALAMLGLALALGGCGPADDVDDDEQEQVLPGEDGEVEEDE